MRAKTEHTLNYHRRVAKECVLSNGAGDAVRVVHAHTNDLRTDEDLREEGAMGRCSIGGRVSLVVTETADCGLLGMNRNPRAV